MQVSQALAPGGRGWVRVPAGAGRPSPWCLILPLSLQNRLLPINSTNCESSHRPRADLSVLRYLLIQKGSPHLGTLGLPQSGASTAPKNLYHRPCGVLSCPIINSNSEGYRGPPSWAPRLGFQKSDLMKVHPKTKYAWVCSPAQKHQRKHCFPVICSQKPT